MNNKYILLWLESPLQAWGASSRLWHRDTLDFPTKSGVIGMLCCGMGLADAPHELLADLGSREHRVMSFAKSKTSGNETVLVNKESTLCDFHMIGSGYDRKNPWELLHILKNSRGANGETTGGSKLSYRHYLQDAFFAVVIEVPEELEEKIVTGLTCPVWELFLGRKCCVPSDIICRGSFFSMSDALEAANKVAQAKQLRLRFTVQDGAFDGDETFTINDVPISFGCDKRYKDRLVTVTHAMPVDEETSEAEHY